MLNNMIAIVGAMDLEITKLLESVEAYETLEISGIKFYLTMINDKRVVITQLGICKVNAAITLTVLFTNFDVDLVINTGIAGGLIPRKKNDIIISDKVYYADVDARFFGYQYGQVPGGQPAFYETNPFTIERVTKINENLKVSNVCSGDQFVTDVTKLDEILKVDPTISVVDMESAAVAHVAKKFNRDFLIIRSISDIINDHDQMDEYNEEASANLVQHLVLDIVKNW